jgi:cytochrome c-type biogenesis protein CcmH
VLVAALLLALVAAPAAGAQTTTSAPGTRTTAVAPRTTLEEVEKELMCSTCRVPLEQSDAPQAQQERQAIERLIAEGLTKDQVIAEMVEIYSESVLIHPPEEGVRTLRWLIPAVAALVGFALVALLVVRWRRSTRGDAGDGPGDGFADAPGPRADDGPSRDPDDGLSDADRARLDADLDRYA